MKTYRVLTGEHWLENTDGSFSVHHLGHVREGEADRNDLANVDGDGRLDAIDESAGDVLCFKIETPMATYYLEKVGAGLSSMLDPAPKRTVARISQVDVSRSPNASRRGPRCFSYRRQRSTAWLYIGCRI